MKGKVTNILATSRLGIAADNRSMMRQSILRLSGNDFEVFFLLEEDFGVRYSKAHVSEIVECGVRLEGTNF